MSRSSPRMVMPDRDPAPGVMTVSGTGSPRPGWNTRSSLHRASPKPLSSARPTRCPGEGVVAFVILRGSATDSRSVGLPQFGHDEDLLRSADRLHVVSDVRLQLHDQRVGSRVPYVDPVGNDDDHGSDGVKSVADVLTEVGLAGRVGVAFRVPACSREDLRLCTALLRGDRVMKGDARCPRGWRR